MPDMASSRPLKRRRLTPPDAGERPAAAAAAVKTTNADVNGETRIKKNFMTSAATWDLEAAYIQRSKKAKKHESTRLPVRTADGVFTHAEREKGRFDAEESDGEWGEEEEDEGERDVPDGDENDDEEAAALPPAIPEAEQVRLAQEELARLAGLLVQVAEPEENPGAFKALAAVGRDYRTSEAVQRLVLATQLAVYRDVIPGYRIRPQQAEDGGGAGGGLGGGKKGEKVSKDVHRVRNYEAALVSGYQAYLKELARHARGGQQGLASVAITCACELVVAVPHFNFRGELLRIVVGRLSRRRGGGEHGAESQDFDRCLTALATLFRDDAEGRPAFESAALLAKMMRAKDYRVDPRVLGLFLHLRLLDEFAGRASLDRVEHDDGGGVEGKRQGKKKEFRTKRERKNIKEQKSLAKDMAAADALVGREEADRMQSETLRVVLGTYFRVLKLRVPSLMGTVLEGLARYANLINQDLFGDLLEALKDLVRDADRLEEGGADDEDGAGQHGGEGGDDSGHADNDSPRPRLRPLPARERNAAREALLCTVTAFALLEGQDAHSARADLHLDLSFFTARLHRALLSLCVRADLESPSTSTSSSLQPPPSAARLQIPGIPDASRDLRIDQRTPSALLLRSLTCVLLPRWQARSVPALRLAAFAKQSLTASLQAPEKTARAMLLLLAAAIGPAGRNPGAAAKVAPLWHTELRRGDGLYDALGAVDGAGREGDGGGAAANVLAATAWEGELLRRHYCPAVREEVRKIEAIVAAAVE